MNKKHIRMTSLVSKLSRILVTCQVKQPNNKFLCTASDVNNDSNHHLTHVFECDPQGRVSKVSKTVSDFATLKNKLNLPIRDMRMFFQPSTFQDSLPVILSRPSSQCFLLKMEHIQLLCTRDNCIILNPDEPVVQAFVVELKNNFKKIEDSNNSPQIQLSSSDSSMVSFLQAMSDSKEVTLEMAVIESTLAAVTSKLKRHLNLLKPIIELLLRETSKNPSSAMLRRMLAFKKSLSPFEMNVKQVRNAIADILKNKDDLRGLCLNNSDTKAWEDMELLLEAYDFDLKEMECQLMEVKEQIEDTEEFIRMHLNSFRNKIIKFNLFMGAGTVSIGVGALGAGMFGMNLTSGLENHSTAFFLVSGGIALMASGLFSVFAIRYWFLSKDYSSAKSYYATRHFFDYAKNIEMALHTNKGGLLNKAEFKRILQPVVGIHLTDKEVENIFKVLDENRDGFVDKQELTNIDDSKV